MTPVKLPAPSIYTAVAALSHGQLVISGAGFSVNPPTVTFGGAAAAVRSYGAPNRMIVDLPTPASAHAAGTYKLQAVWPDGAAAEIDVAIGATGPAGPQGPAAPDPLLIALKRWYDANQSGVGAPTGANPVDLAFDGVNVWASNADDGTVTKIRAADAVVLGTYGVGTYPSGLAYDGANLWVAVGGNGTVVKLRGADGAPLGSYAVGGQPFAFAFDGSSMWMSDNGSGALLQLKPADGSVLARYPVGPSLWGVTFDGTNLWVVVAGANQIAKVSPATGAILGRYAAGTEPRFAAFDGSSVWVAHDLGVLRLKLDDGTPKSSCSLLDEPINVAFDGRNVWVANAGGGVTKLDGTDGAVIATYAGPRNTRGLAFDGANMWVSSQSQNFAFKM